MKKLRNIILEASYINLIKKNLGEIKKKILMIKIYNNEDSGIRIIIVNIYSRII